jgi:uncharacterized SAM-binding protein YcdF (DUF218 family)
MKYAAYRRPSGFDHYSAKRYHARPTMTSGDGAASVRRITPCCITFSLLALTLIVLATSAFFLVGRWLVVEDALQTADAIVVLSGRMPQRALEAARLFQKGYSKQVWLTRPAEPPNLREMHIPYISEDFYSTQVLMHEGVPANAIRALEPTIISTADELQAVHAELQSRGGNAVIIVTSKVHTRRVRTLWREMATSQRAVVRAASTDDFKPEAWWNDTRNVMDVTRELFGLLNAWSGLPIKSPH